MCNVKCILIIECLDEWFIMVYYQSPWTGDWLLDILCLSRLKIWCWSVQVKKQPGPGLLILSDSDPEMALALLILSR